VPGPESAFVKVQVDPAPVWFVEVPTLPARSTTTHSDAEVHDTPVRVGRYANGGLLLSMWDVVQADDPPVGLVELMTFPSPSVTTHSDSDAHETPDRPCWSIEATLHAAVPPVGSVEATTSAPSVATHSEVAVHDIPTVPRLGSKTTGALQAEGPPVGSVEVSRVPAKSTATHKDVDGHETPRSGPQSAIGSPEQASSGVSVHAPAPPAGSVEVSTLFASTATHSDVDGHETLWSAHPPEQLSTCVTVHAPAPPVGSVDVTTFPNPSTATQRDTDGQEMPVRTGVTSPSIPNTGLLGSTRTAVQAGAPAVGSVEVTTFPE
jgi:hypothetical protein